MKEHRKVLENTPSFDLKDYDLQIARLSLDLNETRLEGIQKFRGIFNTAHKYNQSETERVIDLYIEERFPKYTLSEKPLPEDVSNVFFMRGLYAYKNNTFAKAIHFLLPIWKNRSLSYDSMKDAAVSAHLVGIIWSKERSRWKEAEDAYKQSLDLGEQ